MVNWKIDKNGTLIIDSGSLTNSTKESSSFWEKDKSRIQEINGTKPFRALGNFSQFFKGLDLVKSINLSGWNTSCVMDMSAMFEGCTKLKSLNLSNWNTSSVVNMEEMFYGCHSLESLDLLNWDTACVTDMSYMFYGCTSLKSLDLSHWETSCVRDMSAMFEKCQELKSLDLSNWDTSAVTNMSWMFLECCFNSIDLSNWNTSSVTEMAQMFYGCLMESIDLSNWDTSCVTDMEQMFYDCTNLKSLDLSSWNFSSLTNMEEMFTCCYNLNKIILASDQSKIVSAFPSSEDDWYPISQTQLAAFPNDNNEIGLGKTMWMRKNVLVQSIQLSSDEVTLRPSETFQLNPQVTPLDAQMTDIRWISENSSVAKIDQEGLITGCHPGVVLITGTTINGISTQVKVIVQEEETS